MCLRNSRETLSRSDIGEVNLAAEGGLVLTEGNNGVLPSGDMIARGILRVE